MIILDQPNTFEYLTSKGTEYVPATRITIHAFKRGAWTLHYSSVHSLLSHPHNDLRPLSQLEHAYLSSNCHN